jgi:8-oxo-dGTP diphosphatase
VTVLFIRHAAAGDRSRWDEDDTLRPLTKHGREQATGLVAQLADYPIVRVLSSPFLRCVESVEPLAAARGLAVETDDALAEGDSRPALALVRRLLDEGVSAALCSHGDVVPEVVEKLGFDCSRCAKGSTWVLDDERALYLPPPT